MSDRLPTTKTVQRPQAEGYDALLRFGDGTDLYLQLTPSPDRPIANRFLTVGNRQSGAIRVYYPEVILSSRAPHSPAARDARARNGRSMA